MLALNVGGPAGLIDGKASDQPAKLSYAQFQVLAEAVERGPDPERTGAMRWLRNPDQLRHLCTP